ncbi:MAG: hypothetical protein JJU05_11010 [Verrucomicrobia bacterium]|nr:hypothetical protein [Verrucomicrobiota bacterium]MCH8527376.1 hypothetical protein [Kiritimatiellia bacterium]
MNTDQKRKQLEGWLRDYTVWRRLGAESGEVAEEKDADRSDAPDFSGEPAPETGQIRLWPSTDFRDPPLYGLLAAPEYGSWGVLPFSPLALPATPKELKVMEAPPLQVVQGWNLRRISAVQARNSWCAGRLPESESFKLEMFLAWMNSGEAVPALLADHAGPPLAHPLDPRHEYLEDERERTDRTLGASTASGGQQSAPFSKAAEPENDYEV